MAVTLWIVWGVHDEAWALIALQAGLAAMNMRAIFRNERGDPVDQEVALNRRSRESGNDDYFVSGLNPNAFIALVSVTALFS